MSDKLAIEIGAKNTTGGAFADAKKQVQALANTATAGFAKISQRSSKMKVALTRAAAGFNKMGTRVLKSNTKLGAAARAMTRTAMAAGRMAGALGRAGRGFLGMGRLAGRLGGMLRGALTGGLVIAAGAAMGLKAAFSGMYEAMEGSAAGLGAVDDEAESAASGLDNAANASQTAAEKVQGAFGAWGAVGEGFVQAQGKIADEVATTATAAASAASESAAAMDDAQDSIDGATQATTRFGRAMNRIGGAFARAKRIILQAIAKAITPALEKFADLLESPTFKKFVDLLAKDLAKAAEKVGKWIMDKAIPAIEDLMDKINEAGGPVAYFKKKWEELKTRVLMILAIILDKLLEWSNSIRDRFSKIKEWASDAWESVKDGAADIGTAVETAFLAAVESVKGAFNSILRAIEKGVNAAIDAINPFVNMYNAVAEAMGGGKIDLISHIQLPTLAAGGIVDEPTLAMVGDASSPEVIAPLDRLTGILRNLGMGNAPVINVESPSGGGGAPTINANDLAGILRDLEIGGDTVINVTVPAGTPNPQTFGDSVGESIVESLRRSGQRVPVI